MKRYLIGILAFLVIGGGIAMIYAFDVLNDYDLDAPIATEDEDINVDVDEDEAEEFSDVIGENVSFTVTEKDKKKWEFTVEKVYYYKDESGARLFGVSGEFFDDEGQPMMHFKSNKGHYLNEDNVITLNDEVTLNSSKSNASMQAAEVKWSSSSNEIVAQGGVTIQFDKLGVSQCERSRISPDFENIALEGGAHSKINL